jgi:type VI secretion system secreted protein VgrG
MAKRSRSARRAASAGASGSIMVDGSQSVEIGGDQRVTVGGSRVVAIGQERRVSIGKSDRLEVAVDAAVAVGRALAVSTGADATVEVGGSVALSAGKVRLRATQELRLEAGTSVIVLKPNGDILIRGNRIEILGAGEVHLRGSNVHTN